MRSFAAGRELCRSFYNEVVRPLLSRHSPGLRYGAALLGSGSEVLGFDTAMSADHGWSPRVTLYLTEPDDAAQSGALTAALDRELPHEFRGYPVRIPTGDDPGSPVVHQVVVTTISRFFSDYLGFDPEDPLEPADWLTFPEQKLRTIAEGPIYHDGIGLAAVREMLHYYPRDVWLYLLASGWNRIGQEEHLMGRAGFVGDEVGSALIAARLVRDLMRLCFLMERRFAPYPKWFGTAFAQLRCAAELTPIFSRVLAAETWQDREARLSRAYEHVADMHNALGITDRLPAKVGPFFSRPFQVIHLYGNFAEEIKKQIEDPEVLRIAEQRLIGSIDQWSDSTDILSDTRWRDRLKRLYLDEKRSGTPE